MRHRLATPAIVILAAACSSPPRVPEKPLAPSGELAFSVKEANTWNYFYRRGSVAAHLLATSGAAPRIVVAFPAGNSGIGVWFDKPNSPVELAVGPLSPVERNGLRGVTTVIRASAPHLRTSGIVLSSIRVLRDYVGDPRLPAEITNQVAPGPPVAIRRTTLDGAHHFELDIEPRSGATAKVDGGSIDLGSRDGQGSIEVAMTFLHDDPPLTPIDLADLLTAKALPGERDRNALAFLTYREKMLAGSWRFLTYFGRDTLISTQLLMPVLRPPAIEGALGAVIDRLDPNGEVAHEEEIGEFAALHHLRDGAKPTLEPIHDYKMVDDDFMLAPVLAAYALDTPEGRGRAVTFLARKTPSGDTYQKALDKNLAFVLRSAAAFAKDPKPANLVALHQGVPVGDWRDSENGLGGGRDAFSVNVALVPAALAAAARIYDSGLLCPASEPTCRAKDAETARAEDKVWSTRVRPLFQVVIPEPDARALLEAYAKEQGFSAGEANAALDGPVAFPALSLDGNGKPIPVMHSDDGFALLFGDPDPVELERIAKTVSRPFPLGLMTPVGMVIANPAFVTDDRVRKMFVRDAYHGAVIWSWQQAMMAAGLAHQLARTDLPAGARTALADAQRKLWEAIKATEEVRTAEHWSWQVTGGHFAIYRFAEGSDVEANAVQLWSTVYLAVQPPR
jgi:hypothetical protein